MPVALAQKVRTLSVGFRWAARRRHRPTSRREVDLIELVWSNLLRIYGREAALSWLFGVDPYSATAGLSISSVSSAPRT